MSRGWSCNSAVIGLIVGAMCYAAAPPAAAPQQADQDRAQRTIRQLFRDDYVKTTRADRQALARKLLQQALQTGNDSAGRFVLLREARDVAAMAADPALSMRAIDELSRGFVVEIADMQVNSLARSLRSADAPALIEAVMQMALSCATSAAHHDDYVLAAKFTTIADQAAARTKRVALVSQAHERRKDIEAMQREAEQARAAEAILSSNPGDGAARLAMGRHLCFVRGQWDRGLSMLVGCSDSQLQTLAAKDLASSVEPADLLQLGHGWWEFAEKQPRYVRRAAQARAAIAYRKALPKLTGLHRTLAETRVAQFEEVEMHDRNLAPGLAAELYADASFGQKALDRVDSQIDFDWGKDAPAEGMPRDNFSVRWTGMLKPPSAGKYTLIVHANSGARLFIGETKLIDEDNAWRKRSGVRVTVEIKAELQPLKLEFWDGGGEAKVRLLWIAPGSSKEEPIPSGALWHDAIAH